MKKILLLTLILGLVSDSFAQKIHVNTIQTDFVNKKYQVKLNGNESSVPYEDAASFRTIYSPSAPVSPRLERDGETVIGTTTWDEQPSNQRLFPGRGGTLSAVWTGSLWDLGSAGSPNSFPDRGTFYNYFDGNTWGPYPSERIENVYCGYPANVILKNKGEITFAHINEDSTLGTSRRLQVGGTDTFKFDGANRILNVMWPKAAAWEDTVHVIGARQKTPGNNYIRYFRSTDGGQSWDNVNPALPKIDSADCIKYMSGDTYAIDARGSTVAIVGGGNNNTMYLWKSTDNGNSWRVDTIWTFSFCGMDGHTTVTDPIETSDGSYALILDNNNMAHVFCGYTRVSDQDPNQDLWSFEPGQNALLYWNESFGKDSLVVVGSSPDRDGDGQLNIGQDMPNYSNTSLASMPTAAMDTANNIIYCVFAVAMENTDLFNDYRGQSYRDLFGIYSMDNGETWSEQVNLTGTADMQMENVYPAASKYTRNGKVDVMWMRDGEPGTSLDDNQEIQDGVHSNDIVFKSFSIDDFQFTGIKNIVLPELRIYPNPSAGIIYLDLRQLNKEPVSITLTNVIGETVKSFTNISGSDVFPLNLKEAGEGIYFVKAETATQIFTGKVVVSRN